MCICCVMKKKLKERQIVYKHLWILYGCTLYIVKVVLRINIIGVYVSLLLQMFINYNNV